MQSQASVCVFNSLLLFYRATSFCLSQCWTLCSTPEIATLQTMVWVSQMHKFQHVFTLLFWDWKNLRGPWPELPIGFILMEHNEPVLYSGLLFSWSIKQTSFILIGGVHTERIRAVQSIERWVGVCVCFPCRDITEGLSWKYWTLVCLPLTMSNKIWSSVSVLGFNGVNV